MRHANYVVARKTTKGRIYYTLLTNPATHEYSFTCPSSEKEQVPDGVSTSRRNMTLVARCLVPLPIAGSGPVATTARSHGAR